MASSDILVSRLDTIDAHLSAHDVRFDAQDAQILAMRDTIAIIAEDVRHIVNVQEKMQGQLDMLQNFISWGFAFIAIIIAFVSIFVPMFAQKKESSPSVVFYGAVPAQAKEKKEE